MDHHIELDGQRLGALVDQSVNAATIAWIQSLNGQALIRPAAVAWPDDDASLRNIANQLLVGMIDVAVFLTAAGVFRFFERSFVITGRSRMVDACCDINTVAIGNLAAERLSGYGVRPTFTAPNHRSWREVLIFLENSFQLANLSVGLEQTADVHGLAAGLEARGATVSRIDAVGFQQADPSSSEQDILDAIEDGELGAMLFPNAICAARYAFLIEKRERPILRKNSRQLVILAIGNETEELLADRGIATDIVLQSP